MHWIYLNELWKDFQNFLVSGDVTSTWKSWSCVITIPTSWVWFFSEFFVVVQSVFTVEWITGVLWHQFHDTKIQIIVRSQGVPNRDDWRLTFGSSWSFHRACLPTSWFRLVKQRLFWPSFLWWFVKSSIACKLIRSSSSGSCIRTRRFPSSCCPTSMDRRKVDRSSWSSCNEVHPTWSFRLLKLPFVVFWWWSFCFHHWSWSYPKLNIFNQKLIWHQRSIDSFLQSLCISYLWRVLSIRLGDWRWQRWQGRRLRKASYLNYLIIFIF